MRVLGIIPGILSLCLCTGCPKKDTPKTATPAGASAESTAGAPDDNATGSASDADPEGAGLADVALKIVTVDQTNPSERPTDLSSSLQAVAERAAKAAEFPLSDDGHQAVVEVFYALTEDGKPKADAQRGMATWAAAVTVRYVDEDGLSEIFEGRRADERPFVRAALKDVKVAFETLLTETMTGALRDVRMQILYRGADVQRALAGLDSMHPEEVWAGMRRLGELGAKQYASEIVDRLDPGDPLTMTVAIGVLGRLKAPEAVKPLASLASDGEPGHALLAVQALFAIGTDEAMKYVRLIGASHPSGDVQAEVERLLALPREP